MVPKSEHCDGDIAVADDDGDGDGDANDDNGGDDVDDDTSVGGASGFGSAANDVSDDIDAADDVAATIHFKFASSDDFVPLPMMINPSLFASLSFSILFSKQDTVMSEGAITF